MIYGKFFVKNLKSQITSVNILPVLIDPVSQTLFLNELKSFYSNTNKKKLHLTSTLIFGQNLLCLIVMKSEHLL